MKDNIVITGRGLVTPLGSGLERNKSAIRNGESGINFVERWKELGLSSQVSGLVNEEIECPYLNKKNRRYMSTHSKIAVASAYEAINEAGLSAEELNSKNVAIVLGHGGSTHKLSHNDACNLRGIGKGKRVSPFIVPKVMPSSAVANLSLILGTKGETYTISSACASGAHATMIASRLIQTGLYDIVITGGSEEVSWVHASGFDAMRAISRKYNNTPHKSSRPFDKDRDGFVLAAGAGIMILESEKHAQQRNAKQIARISGLSANSNASDMVLPDVPMCTDLIQDALDSAELSSSDIDYINTHGTATPAGDPVEMQSLKEVFYEKNPDVYINSTKSMTGHMIGATGAVELIYCTQMIENNFVCPSINLDNPDPEFKWANLVTELKDNINIQNVLSNGFGFGGTNCCIIVSSPNN